MENDRQAIKELTSDFITQMKSYMEKQGVTQARLAELSGFSESEISQIFTTPSKLSLEKMVRLVRALGLKVGLPAYIADEKAPYVKGEVFRATWESQGMPRDYFDLAKTATKG